MRSRASSASTCHFRLLFVSFTLWLLRCCGPLRRPYWWMCVTFVFLLDASRRLTRSRGAADVDGIAASPRRSKHGGCSSGGRTKRRSRRRRRRRSYGISCSGSRRRRGSGSSNSRWIPAAAAKQRPSNREVSSAVQQ